MRVQRSTVDRLAARRRPWLTLGLAVALWFVLLPGVPVSARVDTCSVASTGVAFGAYDVFSATPTDSTSTVTFKCNGKRQIWIDLSTGSSGSYSQRLMKQGAASLAYNLFIDAAHSAIWGNGASGTSRYITTAPNDNVAGTVTIYSRIPARQDVRIGSYSDTITMTITF